MALILLVTISLLLWGALLWRIKRLPITSRGAGVTLGGYLLIPLFLIMLIAGGMAGLHSLEHQTRSETVESLRTVLHTTHTAVKVWIRGELEHLKIYADTPLLMELVETLLNVPRTETTLLQSDSSRQVGLFLHQQASFHGDSGFYVIAPDHIVIAAENTRCVGKTSIIGRHYSKLLARAFSGESVFIPAVRSTCSVPADGDTSARQVPFMFLAVPIRSHRGEILAVLARHIDPHLAFSEILKTGRIGISGETYAFDAEGFFLSKSRFPEHMTGNGNPEKTGSPIGTIKVSLPDSLVRSSSIPKSFSDNGEVFQNAEGYADYRGIRVLGAWIWDPDLSLGMVSEIDEHEALAAYRGNRTVVLALLGMTILMTALLSGYVVIVAERNMGALEKARDRWEKIASRKNTELLQRTQMFQAIFNQTIQPMAILSPEGHILQANKAARTLAGDIEDLERFRFWEAPWCDGQKELSRKMQEAVHRVARGNTETFEVTISGPDSKELILDFMMSPILDADGNVMFLLPTGHDITKRKKDEEQLKKLFLAVEQTPASVVITDLKGSIEYVNPHFCSLTGYAREEVLGQNPRVLKSEAHPPDFYSTLWTEITEGRVWHGEFCNTKKNGEQYWESAVISPIRDRHGTITHFVAVKQDITERRKAAEAVRASEEALRKERQQLELALQGANLGMWTWHPQTGELQTNDIWEEMLGYAPGTFPARPETLIELIHPDDLGRVRRIGKQHMKGETELYKCEYRMLTRNEGWKWILDIGKVLERDTGGNAVTFSGFHVDIHELKELQEELRKARRAAESATRAKSEFLANMSHEIRTPMNAVIGLTHLALDTDLTSRQRDYLQKIHSSAGSLLGIINEILDFSKIEAGSMKLDKTPFQLDELLRNLIEENEVRILEKKLTAFLDTSPDVPLNLVGDSLRLRQVLSNLISNAVKFTQQGEITVNTRLEESTEERVVLKFSVRDTGIGMTPEQQEKIFNPFSQADTSTTRRFGGTGLGLSICTRLVALMNGTMEVQSAPGSGSTFSFTAAFTPWNDARKITFSIPLDLKGLKILLVDDDPSACELTREALESLTFNVDTLTSGDEAVKRITASPAELPYDLLILDWMLPGISGAETARRILSARPGPPRPKILFISGYSKAALKADLQDLEHDGFIYKPTSRSALFDGIMNAFGKSLSMNLSGFRSPGCRTITPKNLRGARILIAEDNEINQMVITEILEAAGLRVVVVGDGRKAVQAAEKEEFDAILMDIQMPRMDGFEATGRIRAQEGNGAQRTPIIAMTAHAMATDREKCLNAGMNDHLAKPIDPKHLFSTLNKWIVKTDPISEKLDGKASPALREPEYKDTPTRLHARNLPELPGIDTTSALARLEGNSSLFYRLLKKFSAENRDISRKIRTTLAGGETDTAILMAHNLKGASGNLGAATISKRAEKIEEQLRNGSPLSDADLESLNQAVLEVILGLDAVRLDETEKDQDVLFSKNEAPLPEEITNILIRMEKEINESDTAAQTTLEELRGLGRGSGRDGLFTELKKALNGYDFEAAMHLLRQLRQRIAQDVHSEESNK